jgi:hypothetical protein
MINKEIVIKSELPLYDVQEVSLLDAMLLLKEHGGGEGETSITRAAELMKHRDRTPSMSRHWPMTGT